MGRPDGARAGVLRPGLGSSPTEWVVLEPCLLLAGTQFPQLYHEEVGLHACSIFFPRSHSLILPNINISFKSLELCAN